MTHQQKTSVAIIGGGIAGLSCAERLSASSSSFDVTVYDTGRLRPGGRCSTRQAHDDDRSKEEPTRATAGVLSKVRYDHAAQIITAKEEGATTFQEFSQQLREWESNGVLTRFPENSVFAIQSNNKMEPLSNTMYYGTNGMGSIPASIVHQSNGSFQVNQDVWVSPSNGVKYVPSKRQWKVQTGGKVLGMYDYLVIAHNGKCADRLMTKTPAKKIHNLLRVNFSATVPTHGGKRMTLNSIYSLTIALPKNNMLSHAVPDTFIAGFIENHPALRFVTCQTRKYPDDTPPGVEVWTILSSSSFAKKHKAPQEFLSDEIIETVSELLLDALAQALGSPGGGDDQKNKWRILDRRLQLWGAAVPLNVWCHSNEDPAKYLYDAELAVGVCGDWLLEASVAGAWTSGRYLADHLMGQSETDHGLEQDGAFCKSESTAKVGIATLPTA